MNSSEKLTEEDFQKINELKALLASEKEKGLVLHPQGEYACQINDHLEAVIQGLTTLTDSADAANKHALARVFAITKTEVQKANAFLRYEWRNNQV